MSDEYTNIKPGTQVLSSISGARPGTVLRKTKVADSLPEGSILPRGRGYNTELQYRSRLTYGYVVEWASGEQSVYTIDRMRDYGWTVLPDLDELREEVRRADAELSAAMDAVAESEAWVDRAYERKTLARHHLRHAEDQAERHD